MACGNEVLASGEPGQLPPTARLSSMKNGESNGQGSPPRSARVLVEYGVPSRNHVMESVPQSTAKTWKSSASAAPPGRDVDPCKLSAPECPGLCMLPCTTDGSLPMF